MSQTSSRSLLRQGLGIAAGGAIADAVVSIIDRTTPDRRTNLTTKVVVAALLIATTSALSNTVLREPGIKLNKISISSKVKRGWKGRKISKEQELSSRQNFLPYPGYYPSLR
jgi:hypothetical protein